MKSLRPAATFRNLRTLGVWRLLASDTAPVVLALLQTLLFDKDKSLPSSVIHERLHRELLELRAVGEDMQQTAQGYLAHWLREGWVSRRFPAGAAEEVYELTTDSVAALRIVASLSQPRKAATESRLATVIQQLTRLAEETDSNPTTRLAALEAEKARIDREIAQVQKYGVTALADDRALERTREIISLAEELTGDFRRVRDEFERLNKTLRENIVEHEGGRGEVLEALFAGVDLIGESEAGKTFNAFWRLLTDPEQATTLEAALNDVISRTFAAKLSTQDRRFLLQMTKRLMDEGRGVHDVLQSFAKSLRNFVQSREFLEQRRLHDLLKEAQKAALLAKEHVRLSKPLNYSLFLTSCLVRSAAQWGLFDPSDHSADGEIIEAPPSDLSLAQVQELIQQSEIDFRTLKAHIRHLLSERSQVTIGDLLHQFPAEQGLGSVVGYIALGAKHGEPRPASWEVASWATPEGPLRRVRIPTIFFTNLRAHELDA